MESGRLQGKNLGWRFGQGAWLFRHYSVEVNPGEIVGLMGPSGTGKTTLGRLLGGYMPPVEGEVTIAGVPLRSDGYRPVQHIHQHPELAVNPRWVLGKTITEGWQPDAGLLEVFGVEETWLRRYPNELSGGQLQRCCIVRSLGPGTKFVIADEMSAMLDAITQAEIWHALLTVARIRDIGIVAISHDKPLLDAVCDRTVRLESASYSGR